MMYSIVMEAAACPVIELNAGPSSFVVAKAMSALGWAMTYAKQACPKLKVNVPIHKH